MIRVLLVSLEPPVPPLNGLRLPLVELVRRLPEHVELHVVALGDGPVGDPAVELVPPPARGTFRRIWRLARGTLLRRPMSADAFAHAVAPIVRDAIRDRRPDVVHVFSGRLAALAPAVERHASVLTALDAWHRNVAAKAGIAGGARRFLLADEERRVRRFERLTYPRFGRVVTVTDEDASALRAVAPTVTTVVIPNGVDAERFAPRSDERRDDRLLVLHGAMDYAPNVTAARTLVEDVLPLVRRHHPGTRVAVVGRDPTPQVRELASRPAVQVTGTVEDVRPWLARAAVYVCPVTVGTGLKNKVLEAMAAGAAVVTTPLGVQGLATEPGKHVLVGTTVREIADHTIRLLGEPGLAATLGRSGRSYVLEQHSWDTVTRAYVRLYGSVLAELEA